MVLAPNTYDMTAFDVSSGMQALTATPAVVVTSIVVVPINASLLAANFPIGFPYTSTALPNGNLAKKKS